MIQLYTGVPGSGKTYKMVHDLSRLLKKEEGLTVISNISGLKLPHADFDKILKDRFPDNSLSLTDRLERFFTYEHQQSLNEEYGGPLMYVLDECQEYFPRRLSLPNTEYYFQRHRHLGHYIFLATQSHVNVSRNILALVELEYRSAPRTFSLFGELRYHQKTPLTNVIISTVTHRPKQEIFDLYKSFENEEIRKPRRLLVRRLWPVLLLPLAVWLFYTGVPKPPPKKAEASASSHVPGELTRKLTSSTNGDLPPAPNAKDIEIQRLKRQMEELEKEDNQMVRVFLMVVRTADKALTVDPETNAVVELKALASRGVSCAGDTCYYDKPSKSMPKPYEPSRSSGGGSSFGWTSYAPSVIKNEPSGAGSFVSSEMVPPPDRPVSQKNF